MAFTDKIKNVYRQEIVGEPQLIEPTDFGLADPSVNAQRFTEFSDRSGGKLLKKFGPDKRYELIQFSGNIIIGLDRSGNRVVYYVHFKTVTLKGLTFVTQTTLWAHPILQDEASKTGLFSKQSISTYVFFDILLKMHDGLLTDTQQTTAGQRFWFKRITVALDRGLHVSLIDKATKKAEPIKSRDDLHRQEHHIWTAESGARTKLLAITKKAL